MSDVDDELDEATQPAHSSHTWPFVVEALIKRFLTDEVLQTPRYTVKNCPRTV